MNYNEKWGESKYTPWNYKKIYKGSRYSAGILPYTFDQNGKCLFLLGKDNDNDWSDFGGRCEFKDHGDEKNTAIREFYEETLGAVINVQEALDKINNGSTKVVVSKTLNGSPYYMYLVYIDYLNYTDIFNKMITFLRYQNYKMIEKTSIRWVSIDTILYCIENKLNKPINLRGVFYNTICNCKEQLQLLIK